MEDLLGKTILKITKGVDSDGGDKIIFIVDDGYRYEMLHHQDCCESVYIDDINGDLDDLIGTPLLQSEMVSNNSSNYNESCTWTFYKFATKKGYVNIKWFGTSNGYYSEGVDFYKYEDENAVLLAKIEIRDKNMNKLI